MKNIKGALITGIIFLIICSSTGAVENEFVPYDLTINLRVNPVGTTLQPRFCWKLKGDKRNTVQTYYSLRVSESNDFKSLTWASGKTQSSQSVFVPYTGNPLESGKIYYWQVKVWDNYGNESIWSNEFAFWQTGLLDSADWQAKWIQGANLTDSINGPALYFRKQFDLSGKIKTATLYVTSHGMYEAFLNGQRIGNDWFTPGWTSYNKRLQYQVYDVTSMVKSGANAIGVTLASGWYRTEISDKKELWGKKLALLLQLEITLGNGEKRWIVTDKSWKSTDNGAIGNWMYTRIAGIQFNENYPGYKKFIIYPKPGGGLRNGVAKYDSNYGTIVSAWEKEGDKLTLNVTIPPNTSAEVCFDKTTEQQISENGKALSTLKTAKIIHDKNKLVVEIGSGKYSFEVDQENN